MAAAVSLSGHFALPKAFAEPILPDCGKVRAWLDAGPARWHARRMKKTPADSASRTKTTIDSGDEIATLRIELAYTAPAIRREVEAPTSINFLELHDIVQSVMSWEDCHLWEFTIGKQRVGLPMDDDWGDVPCSDASKVCLGDVLKPRKTTIGYLYDFGDSWEHRITVTKIRAAEPSVAYPCYVAGEYNAPPEDCGGLPGFYNTLDALADPRHPDHAHAKEWFEDYDPKSVDTVSIKNAVGRLASWRGASKKRASKKWEAA